MKRILILVATGLALLSTGATTAFAADGAKLYNKKCAMCHGKDGVAKSMAEGSANFSDAEFKENTSVEDLVRATTEGIADSDMPAYEGKFSSEEIQAIAEYIKTL